MKNALVLVADLGNFKAFRMDNGYDHSKPRLELLDEFHDPQAHSKLTDRVTDQAGRFPGSPGPAAAADVSSSMTQGERHNIELERRRRSLRRLANRINCIVRENDPERCYLAVGREINRQLLDELEPGVRGKIERIIPSNLTTLSKSDLLDHFQKALSE